MTPLTQEDFIFSRTLFARLATVHHKPAQGVNRLGYTKETRQATQLLCHGAYNAFGAIAYQDLAGTCYIVMEPTDPQDRANAALAMGSHTDAVPNGGQYDGMAGVIAGLQTMEIIARQKIPFHAPLVTVLFPNEESSRFQFAVSAKASTGRLPVEALAAQDKLGSGETLAYAMTAYHSLDTQKLQEALASFRALMPHEELAAFVEPHIEQSDELADAQLDIGIVHSIKGTHRAGYVRFDGRADHSGACPQAERQDAVLGGAHFIVKLEEGLTRLRQQAADLTFSFGDTRVVGGGSLNIVSANNEVLFDIRSSDENALKKAMDIVQSTGQTVAKQRGLTFTINEKDILLQKPVQMNPALVSGLASAAEQLGLKAKTMPSGPGHDSAILQQSGRASSVLFIPHRNGSHRPDERMTLGEQEDPFALTSGYASTLRVLLAYAQGQVIKPQRCGLSRKTRPCPFVQKLISRGAVQVFP